MHPLVKSILSFGDAFENVEHQPVELMNGTSTLVPCMSKGGNPPPKTFTATLKFENGTTCRELEEITNLSGMSLDNDNTTEIMTKHFLLIPHLADHGKHVHCDIIQGDNLFHETDERKIAVVFPPKETPEDITIDYPVSTNFDLRN